MPQPENTPLTFEAIRDMTQAFKNARILLTAFELGIFTLLSDQEYTSDAVATRLSTDPRATNRLLNAMAALGLLHKKGERFANTAATRRYLDKHSPDYQGGMMHSVHLWDNWSTLTEAVRVGHSVYSRPLKDRNDDWQTGFIAAMHNRATEQAPATVRQLDLTHVQRVLDVGGGSGIFSMAFVQAKSGLQATVFDLPVVTPLTEKYIAEAGLEASIRVKSGDYLVDAFGEGYDLIFLSAIVHINSFAENEALIQKSANALNPGGQVVVRDFVMSEDRMTPARGAIFALNMLVGTQKGDSYTESEIHSWMTAAGLHNMERKDDGLGSTMVVGYKP